MELRAIIEAIRQAGEIIMWRAGYILQMHIARMAHAGIVKQFYSCSRCPHAMGYTKRRCQLTGRITFEGGNSIPPSCPLGITNKYMDV